MKKEDINKECHQIWEELGLWWDSQVPKTEIIFIEHFIYPVLDKFLEVKRGRICLRCWLR